MVDLEDINGKLHASTELKQDTLQYYQIVESGKQTSLDIDTYAFDFQTGDEMSIYVFDLEVLETERWATIKQEKMYLKKIDIVLTSDNYNDLHLINTYP